MDHFKSCKRKNYCLTGFDTLLLFSIEFSVFACFYCCFHNHKTYCDVLLMTKE